MLVLFVRLLASRNYVLVSFFRALVRSIAVASVCTIAHAQVPTYPVIFIHGLNDSGYTWAQMIKAFDPTRSNTAPRLSGADNTCRYASYSSTADVSWPYRTNEVPNWKPYTQNAIPNNAKYFVIDFSDSNDRTLAEQGIELGTVINCVKTITTGTNNPLGKVILVGHSMGGLAARSYLQSTRGSDVDQLITIGTPHRGASNPVVYAGSRNYFVCKLLSDEEAQGRDNRCAKHVAVKLLTELSGELSRLNEAGLMLPPSTTYHSIVVTQVGFPTELYSIVGDGVVDIFSQSLASTIPYFSASHPNTAPDDNITIYHDTCAGAQAHSCEPRDMMVMTVVGRHLGVPNYSALLAEAIANSATSVSLGASFFQTSAGTNSATGGIEWGTNGSFTNSASTPVVATVRKSILTSASGLPGTTVNFRAFLNVGGIKTYSPTKNITIPPRAAPARQASRRSIQSPTIGTDLAIQSPKVRQAALSSVASAYLWPNMPKPLQLEPADGFAAASERQILRWSEVANATSYRLMIAARALDIPTDPTVSQCPACLVNAIAYGNSYMVDANELVAGQSYFWRVKARSPNQYGELSDAWQFSLPSQTLLSPPSPSSPLNGEQLKGVPPTLAWQSVPGATSYRIFVARDATMLALQPSDGECANCVLNTTTSETQLSLDPADFAPGSSYYWVVKGRNAAQYGSFSSLSRFFVGQSQCNFGFAGSSIAPSALGGTYPLTLTTQPGCSASATTNQSYCTVSPSPITADSSGQAGLNLSISANGAAARSCTVTVGNATLSVSQPANAPAQSWTFTLNQATGGTAWVSPNQSVFADGATVNLSASPSSGYAFAGWLDSGTVVSPGANFAFPIHSSRTLTPSFSSTQVTVTGSISPSVTSDQRWRVLGDRINSMTTWQSNGQTISLQSGISYRVDCADTPYYQPSANTFNFTPGNSFSCNYSAKAQQAFSPSLTLHPQPRLASGMWNSLARLDDGRTLVWGFWQYMDFPNYSAGSPQMGTPTLLRPLFLPYSDDVVGVNISSGQLIGMATLSNTGTWKSWGNSANSAVRVPTVDSSLNGFVRMSGTLGLKADGSLWFVNQTGSNTPVTTVADIVDIAGTYRSAQTLALRKDGAIISLTYDGDTSNCYTQGVFYLPNGPYQNCTIPVAIPSLNRVVSIAAATYNAFAVKDDGTVWVWGFNNVTGGAVRPANDNRPIQVPGIADAAQVVAGGQVAYVRTKSGSVYAWGANDYGQLGRGTVSPFEANSQVIAGLTNIVELGQTDGRSLLAMDGNGFVWTVGVAMSVGNGTSVTTQSTPVKVSCPNGFVGDLNLTSFASSCIPATTNTLTLADRNSAGGKQVLINGAPITLPYSQAYLFDTQVTMEVLPDIGIGFGGLLGDLGEFKSRIRTLRMNRDWNLLLDTYNCSTYPGNSSTVVNGSTMVPIVVGSVGGSQTVPVLTDTAGLIDKCHWGFYTTDSWIHANADGFGPSSFVMNIEPNPGSVQRVGNFKVGGANGHNIQVTQAAAAVDSVPDAISFPAYIGAVTSTLIQSSAITVSGINTAASISVANGEYSIGCNGTFTQATGTISSGQSVCVRQTSSSSPQTSTLTTLTVGGLTGVFTVTTQSLTSGVPTGVSAASGNAQATVSFIAPGSNGGSNIAGYTVSSNPAGGVDTNAGTTALTHTITGLTNGTAYTFTVTATDSTGAGTASASSNSITPQAPQSITFGTAPTVVVGGTGAVSGTGGASGNAVTFTSTTTSICSVSGTSGSTVMGVAAGTCTIAANQASSASFSAATQVLQSFTVSPAVQTGIPASERAVLVSLYNSTNGASWTNNAGWMGAVGTECTWFGITCDGTQSHVTVVRLNSNNLVGTLPALDGLTSLTGFIVDSNQLTGLIPSLSNLIALQELSTNYNQFSGSIPPLSQLSVLRSFGAAGNQLTGSIPLISGLTTLQYFGVEGNQLSGSVPSLSGLTALQFFFAGPNQLTGSIPSLDGLTALRSFFVGANQLTGGIPTLTGLTALQSLDVRSNQLTGSIPSLSGLTALESLDVRNNQLTGSIPALSGLSLFSYFGGTGNQLTGAIPPLSGLTALQYFWVDNNQLTGPVPTAPSSLLAGQAYLCGNQLVSSGNAAIDAAWVTAVGGDWLACQTATPTAIPATERAVLINLYTFTDGANWTNRNNWNGAAGTECTWYGVTCDGTMSHVEKIYLTGNNLVGSLPPLNGLTVLQDFDVAFNNLTGSIPSLSGMLALRFFSTYVNQLTGSIPSLSGVTALQSFFVGNNQLTGPVNSAPSSLLAGASYLCANSLTSSGDTAIDAAWVTATGGNWLACQTVPSLISQAISFTNPGAKKLGAAPFALSATGGASGNPVTFASQTSSICTVSGSTVTLVSAGTCTVDANQAGNASYAAATLVTQSFAVTAIGNAATPFIDDQFNGTTLDATLWTMGGNSATVHSGYLDLQANQTDNTGWVKTTFTERKHIRVEFLHHMHAGNDYFFPSITLGAINPNGVVAVRWLRSAYGPDYCSLAGNYDKVEILAGYTATLPCAWSFSNLVSSSYYDKWILSILDYDSATGIVTLDVDGDGTVDYSATVTAANRSPVTSIHVQGYGWGTGHWHQIDYIKGFDYSSALSSQVLTFGTAPTVAVTGTGVLSATGGASGNAVTFTSITTSICTASGTNGSTVTGVAAGTCTIAADQAGNASYAAAAQVTQSFSVTPPTITATLNPTASSLVSSAGGAGTVSVITASANAWTASSNANWITIISGATGSGNGSVGYSVAANTDSVQRTGTLTIADQTFSVGQTTSVNLVTFADNFDGASLQSAYWTPVGVGVNTVTGGVVNFACRSSANTAGKYHFAGDKIIVEARMVGTGTLRDITMALVDVAGGGGIQVGDTNYQGMGLYTYGNLAFNLAQAGNGTSINAYKEYRLTVNGASLTLERGDTLANISETRTVTLGSSIVGHTFSLNIGNGGPDYCPGSYDWIRVMSTTGKVITPTTSPDAPTNAVATGGNASAAVSFTAPVNTGGSAITGYTVTSNPAGGVDSNAGTTALIHAITSLTNGTTYTFTVKATNGVGTGVASGSSNGVTPVAVQAITFGSAPTVAVGGTGTVSANGGASGNAVTFTSTTTGICTVSGTNGGTVTGVAAGACIIAANQAGNTSYAAAAQVTQNITVGSSTAQGLSFAPGWNLLGNSLNQALSVLPTFADTAIVSTVWKWDVVKAGWQFYTPLLSSSELQAYAASKGFGVLSVINPGEGYWVNAKAAASLGTLNGAAFTLTSANLTTGWNLVATGSDVTPSAFNLSLSLTPPTPGAIPANLTALWAWDNALSQWYFYAPSLHASGGLAAYIAGKGYLDFVQSGKTLGNGVGFWVNRP